VLDVELQLVAVEVDAAPDVTSRVAHYCNGRVHPLGYFAQRSDELSVEQR
jgi:hypothetical protein